VCTSTHYDDVTRSKCYLLPFYPDFPQFAFYINLVFGNVYFIQNFSLTLIGFIHDFSDINPLFYLDSLWYLPLSYSNLLLPRFAPFSTCLNPRLQRIPAHFQPVSCLLHPGFPPRIFFPAALSPPRQHKSVGPAKRSGGATRRSECFPRGAGFRRSPLLMTLRRREITYGSHRSASERGRPARQGHVKSLDSLGLLINLLENMLRARRHCV